MKTLLLFKGLLLSGLLVSGIARSQTNTYFDNNPVWQLYSSCAFAFPCIENEYYNYYINGDTTFNSLVYKKTYKKGHGTYNWMSGPPANCSGSYSYINPRASYFLRSSGKQMFVRSPSDTSEFLLYDFDLQVGDLLPLTFNNYDANISVTAIDSIYTPYGYRKRFTLSGNTWSQELLEGIGHTRGLIEPLNVPLECGFTLECFSLNDSAYYPASGPICNLTVGVPTPEMEYTYTISPNPTRFHSILTLNKNIGSGEVNIFNASGQLVKSQIFNDSREITIYRDQLLAGIYTINLVSYGHIIAKDKLIFTD